MLNESLIMFEKRQHLWKLSGSKYSRDFNSLNFTKRYIYTLYINSLENMYENNSRRLTVCYVFTFSKHIIILLNIVFLRSREETYRSFSLLPLTIFLQLQAIYSANNQVKSTEKITFFEMDRNHEIFLLSWKNINFTCKKCIERFQCVGGKGNRTFRF